MARASVVLPPGHLQVVWHSERLARATMPLDAEAHQTALREVAIRIARKSG
jgi:Arc/MetJ family transcription regulator